MNDNRYWRLETRTTGDTGDWRHERQILELLPGPWTTTDTVDWSHEQQQILEPQEPQATTTGATNDNRYWRDWSHERQEMILELQQEPQTTYTGAANDRWYNYWRQQWTAGGATGLIVTTSTKWMVRTRFLIIIICKKCCSDLKDLNKHDLISARVFGSRLQEISTHLNTSARISTQTNNSVRI